VRGLVTLVVIVAIAVAGALGLLELTENRPDPIVPGSTSEIVLDVATKPPITERQGAAGLWAVCLLRAHQHRLVGQRKTRDDVVYVIKPALGEHSRRRVVGCLEDATIERVLGHVTAVRTRPPS
jgi:hypothetical protein